MIYQWFKNINLHFLTIPIEQNIPVKPAGQVQVYVQFCEFKLQKPLFKHGLELHGLLTFEFNFFLINIKKI